MSETLRAESLGKVYKEAGGPLRVLDDVSLEARPGEMLAIVGTSGAGKSTLLHLLGLLDTPTEGKVFYGDRDLNRLSASARAHIRNRLFGFVFQFFHLFPDFTALENVMMPALVGEPLGRWFGVKRRWRDRSRELLDRMGLLPRERHRPSELSGGERQRVAIARALISDPEILYLDEPTGNLDSKTGAEIMDLILALREEHNRTVVMVTHDAELAAAADRILRIHDGRIVEEE